MVVLRPNMWLLDCCLLGGFRAPVKLLLPPHMDEQAQYPLLVSNIAVMVIMMIMMIMLRTMIMIMMARFMYTAVQAARWWPNLGGLAGESILPQQGGRQDHLSGDHGDQIYFWNNDNTFDCSRNVVYASIDGRGTGFQSNEHLFQVKPKQHKNCLFFIKKI